MSDVVQKFFLKSKTVWGVIVMALPTLLPVLGVNLGQDETALITSTGDQFVTAIGGLLAIYGRFKAGGIKV
jgi:hypothetical protein